MLGSTIGLSAMAETTDQRCAKGAEVRRIEIRFHDDQGSLPCRVIYRPEAESETVGIVSWQEIQSLEACEAQANEVIERLTGEGWSCATDWDMDANDRLQRDAASTIEPNGTTEELSEDSSPLASKPATTDGGSVPEQQIDEPARLVDNPEIAQPSDDLASLIETDLGLLDKTLDGLLEAKVAGYGDLNADNIEDALVLYTYSSPQPAYRQYLAAYMSDGETYQLTATKPVGGNVNATRNAKVETVDQGVVHLSLKAFEPGDPACCPSGERRIALALRDLDLVEIDAETPTR